ncbi:MAG TPA: hypothetical protein VEQ67_00535 [Mycobacterium sp.]|nr:hypothetical protein [Mycobacterium sp.]
MRSLRLAAAAILAGSVVVAAFGVALAAPANLAVGFPATRIKLDPPATPVTMPGPITMTATVVDWRGSPLANVPVVFANVTVPQKPSQLGKGTTDKAGHVTFAYSNGKEPRIDVVQATFTDGLEVHKSNRSFIAWQSGTPATAIPSPAAITVTPGCFQPATAAALASDTFKPGSPRTTPRPSARATPTPVPPPVTYTINVDGVNFNPYSAVLVTFDAGPGGTPESYERTTDVFGHFNFDIQVRSRSEGVHLVRADDFRQREADTTYRIPCFQPSVALNPPIGPPGFVTYAVGRGFPPKAPIMFLNWGTPALRSPLPKAIKTDENGSFQFPILVLYHDLLGPRMLQAIVANPFGERAGAAIEADAPFLVTPGRAQPSDLVLRR